MGFEWKQIDWGPLGLEEFYPFWGDRHSGAYLPLFICYWHFNVIIFEWVIWVVMIKLTGPTTFNTGLYNKFMRVGLKGQLWNLLNRLGIEAGLQKATKIRWSIPLDCFSEQATSYEPWSQKVSQFKHSIAWDEFVLGPCFPFGPNEMDMKV